MVVIVSLRLALNNYIREGSAEEGYFCLLTPDMCFDETWRNPAVDMYWMAVIG